MIKGIKKRKKSNKISVIIFIIVVGIFCSYMLIKYFSNKIGEVLMVYAESEVTNLMTLIINKSVSMQLEGSFDEDVLFDIVRDSDGNVNLIDFNSLEVNKVLRSVIDCVALNLKLVEDGRFLETNIFNDEKVDRDNLSRGIIYEIPIGAVTKSSLLANMGPKIPVKMHIIGDVVANVATSVKEYGINNALLQIGIYVEASGMVNLPFVSKKIMVNTTIPLSLKLIQGRIPNYYLNGINSSSNLAFLN